MLSCRQAPKASRHWLLVRLGWQHASWGAPRGVPARSPKLLPCRMELLGSRRPRRPQQVGIKGQGQKAGNIPAVELRLRCRPLLNLCICHLSPGTAQQGVPQRIMPSTATLKQLRSSCRIKRAHAFQTKHR